VQVFGEFSNKFTGPDPRQAPWKDWYHDVQVLSGKLVEPLRIAIGSYRATSDIASLKDILVPEYPGFVDAVPDQYRVEIFLRRFAGHVRDGDLPSLTIMTFPNDHGVGEGPGIPVYDAQFADNDLATGRVVEAISRSPYWKDSAIFIVEDDAAYGVDHIDGHRSPVFVISPYAKRAYVDHTYYTQIDIIRTIEQILGLPPMNQRDLAATPLATAFGEVADLTPYSAVPNRIPLDRMTPVARNDSFSRIWAATARKILAKLDEGDEVLTSHAIWYGTHNYSVPYPGERRLFLPSELKRAARDGED
jgi:hypothetical protein